MLELLNNPSNDGCGRINNNDYKLVNKTTAMELLIGKKFINFYIP